MKIYKITPVLMNAKREEGSDNDLPPDPFISPTATPNTNKRYETFFFNDSPPERREAFD